MSLSLSFSAACSSSPVDGGASGGAGGVGGAGGASGGKAAVQCDAGPGYSVPSEAQELTSVSATLLDVDGVPIVGERFEVCGLDVCSPPAHTGSDGRVVVSPDTSLWEKKPAAKFGEGVTTPRFAIPLPAMSKIDLGVVHTVRLPALGSGAPLVEGATASSEGLSLSLSAGTQIKIDQLTYEDEAQQHLRAVRVPLESHGAGRCDSWPRAGVRRYADWHSFLSCGKAFDRQHGGLAERDRGRGAAARRRNRGGVRAVRRLGQGQ
ncbi:MAG: hypothetical protein QM756_17720 [Polyangiaceae bacterium]